MKTMILVMSLFCFATLALAQAPMPQPQPNSNLLWKKQVDNSVNPPRRPISEPRPGTPSFSETRDPITTLLRLFKHGQ